MSSTPSRPANTEESFQTPSPSWHIDMFYARKPNYDASASAATASGVTTCQYIFFVIVLSVALHTTSIAADLPSPTHFHII